MRVLCTIFVVCLIVAAVNAGDCPDKSCPDGQSCVRVLGSNYCVKDAKQGRACSDQPGSNGVYDMVPPCASGLTCDTSKTIPTCK
ncbi:hypothetical protein TNCT_428571 [Trichonephila clavata]|uniref:Uncharacterized protein n=1 Tax=Trichonephila clavata TaxID=2740835 RepID=A0A8X6JFQ9_TRICU|nr:hypothetical protein TNCT_428571 [Trichonephila clavata]